MNEKALQVLEYDKIRKKLVEYTTTEMGQRLALRMHPLVKQAQIQHHLDQTKDGADILRLKGGIPLPRLGNIRPFLKRLDIGASLNGQELAAIGLVLRTTNQLKVFFRDLLDEEVQLLSLDQLVDELVSLPQVGRRLLTAIDNDGFVTDEASSLLRSLRRQIATTETQIREQLGQFTRGNNAKYLSNAIVTIRNDRYVIPVRQEYRNKFGGVVHDQSASGQTVFVEPRAIVELNNRLKRQQSAEREEVKRILAELSALIAPYTEELQANAHIIGQLDFVNAKARYAHAIKATEPIVDTDNNVYLRQVWHPLLVPQKAVRNDIMLGKDYQAIIITGPNTGGKTITLKTLGLVQMMGQSGLFIPAYEESRIGIFTDIFADIGDEQSIEQNLSTFSSHMVNIVNILQHIDAHSLVLFDELGAGTDPQEGASLAIAILDAVGATGAYVVATTHYPELKAYGFERPGTINASMEFDVETLQPTYRLLVGIPGRSNAFNISRRLGLDETIIAAAQELTTQDSQDLNAMITDLVAKRHQAEEEAIALQKHLEEAEKLHHDLAQAYEKLVAERSHLTEQAKMKANDIVQEAQKKADAIINDLRAMRLNGAATVKENQLIDAQTQLNSLHQDIRLQHNKVLRKAKEKQALHPNDDVLVRSYGQQGVLIQKLGDKQWEVQLGILKMKIDEDDLEKIHVQEKKQPRSGVVLRSAQASHVSSSLDLRGQRYEEALTNIDRYIDAALLAGYKQVTIVHGKGTGALRSGITKYLENNRSVKKFQFAPPNAGGNGATIVYFK
ncbi:endonuclease MutS2 [Ligilactobacillus saerimneri]|uniref:Endonuclease MutS2 n=1 Tax=Ligilactobacillus saerimneri TaxID=228229 RepID=A0A7H9EKN0_9LACO|nr:endonuclease MutS2 [Ligilactobacillus saerimneri]QLL78234.1 endonuclease MutS2 [Ligilactobacillus saerimneri]